jgi:hypothetical protein
MDCGALQFVPDKHSACLNSMRDLEGEMVLLPSKNRKQVAVDD